MTGPSLRSQDAHSAIHEAALNEVRELNRLYRECLVNDEPLMALKVADVVVEHWESRTLKHAQTEEEELYRDIAGTHPEARETIQHLTRDHDLMRRIVGQMKQNMLDHRTDEAGEALTYLMEALVIIDEIHNEDEMIKLLSTYQDRNVM